MDGLLLLAGLAALICCGIVIGREQRRRQRHKRMVGYLRQSDLYAHLYPMVRRMERMYVESVAVRREEVCVRTFEPAGRVLRFTFEKHGFDPLDDDRLYPLALALAVDAPFLRDGKHYDFLTHEDLRLSGGKGAWYEYMIRTEHKDNILRAGLMKKR